MYTFQRVETDTANLQRSSDLLRRAFPEAKKYGVDFLRWQYHDNPEGKVVGFEAFSDDGELAAHYVTIPVAARLDGRSERGLLSLNTATDPSHQCKGLSVKLASKTYELGAGLGFSFVVGVANANSTHGFVNKLGFQLVSPLLAKIGFGLPRESGDQPIAFAYDWNTSQVAWRLANPVARYAYRRGTVLGATDVPGVTALLAYGLPYDLELPKQSAFFSPLRLWLGLDPHAAWSRSALIELPSRFRKSPLNLIFLDLSSKGKALQKEAVRFSTLDFDAF